MESKLISEFITKTGASETDAISCLKTWNWDLKKALTDYKDTPSKEIQGEMNLAQRNSKKLTKCDAIEIDYRKLARGISRATDNVNIVSRARSEIAMDFQSNYQSDNEYNQSIDTPDFTFILPNIFKYPEAFRCFLEKDLIDCSALSALEQSNRLNWWVEGGTCRKLWPLATTGDGNCLLHAASLGMWGFHDRKLTLRKVLFDVLSKGKIRSALWRRWRFQQTRNNKTAGFVYSETEWAKEWEQIVAMSSPEPRNTNNLQKDIRKRISACESTKSLDTGSVDDSATYESLEEIHILALAHILRRTIIVISDTLLRDMNGDAMAPIPFGGVYLPFEINSSECNRGPLLLAYDMAHFSALVPMECETEYPLCLIPLIDHEEALLPIQYCIDPGENFSWRDYDGSDGNWLLSEVEHLALLKEYLDTVHMRSTGSPDNDIFDDLTDEEADKKFTDSEVIISSGESNNYEFQNNKSKTPKQFQNVAKHFGSIGKTMSRKIKKNIGSITKIGNRQRRNMLSSGCLTQNCTYAHVLCARLRVKRHDFQEEMIQNYLEFAYSRFLGSGEIQGKLEQEVEQLELLTVNNDYKHNDLVKCINGNCSKYANSETSYLCLECFERQKQRESIAYLNNAPRYQTGKSKFYTQADNSSHDSIRHLPPVRRLNEMDQTLYLSNSTFYNDTLPVNPELITVHRDSVRQHEYNRKLDFKDTNNMGKRILSPLNVLDQSLISDFHTFSSPSIGQVQSTDLGLKISGPTLESQSNTKRCRTPGCLFYGSSSTDFYCSICWKSEMEDCLPNSVSSPNKFIYPTANVGKTRGEIMSYLNS